MQFCDALQYLGRMRNWLVLLLLLCLLAQIAAFILVDFAGVLGTGDDFAVSDGDAEIWRTTLIFSLAATKFLGLVGGLLLMLTIMFSVKVSLVGRVGATSGFLGAFFWSLVLLAVLMPWQQILNSSVASGATFNLEQFGRRAALVRGKFGASDDLATVPRQIVYYARFLAYPVVAILMVLLVSLKFKGGFKPLKYDAAETDAAPAAASPVDSSSIEM